MKNTKSPNASKKTKKRFIKPNWSFSKTQLIAFGVAFALVGGYLLYISFAAAVPMSKVWDSSTDFGGGTASGVTVSSDGLVKLTASTTSSAGVFGSKELLNTSKQSMISDYKYANKVTFNGGGPITKLSAFLSASGTTSGTQQLRMDLYKAGSDGEPSALVFQTNAVSVSTASVGTAGAFVDFPLATAVNPGAGQYWMAIHTGATSGLIAFSYVLGSGATRGTPDVFSDGSASSFAGATVHTSDPVIEMYGTYGAATTQQTSLSSLAWTAATNGSGPVVKNKSNGGSTLSINGVKYTSGLGAHAPSTITYNLAGGYTAFASDMGVDDECSGGSVIFSVVVDGTTAYTSGVMNYHNAAKHVSLNVTGKNQLQLVISSNGTTYCDHADWAGAQLTSVAPPSTIQAYPASGTLILPFDAGQTASWSSLVATGQTPTGTSLGIEGRSSTDNVTFSGWSTTISSLPSGRYLQIRLTLNTTVNTATPLVDKLTLGYTIDDGTPPPPPTVTSSTVLPGATIASGTAWTVAISTTPQSVEFWADGTKLAQPTAAPFTTTLNLSAGTHQLGLCATVSGIRTCFGSGGIYANITVTGSTTTSPPTNPTPPVNGIQSYEITNMPNYVNAGDNPTSNYNVMWVYPTSSTTPWLSPDSCKCVQRYMLLDPRLTDSSGKAGQDDWWMIINRRWPSSFDPNNHGAWGREVNFHNVAGDAGPAGSGGVGWGFGDGVSSLALDWLGGNSAPEFSTEPNTPHEWFLPVPTRDTWHTYVVHWVAGRNDGTTLHPGSLEVWVDGSSTPAINQQNINTVQRAKGPDGNYYVQHWMTLWEGDYTQNLPVKAVQDLALTRLGTTLAQAVADRPVAKSIQSGYSYTGSGLNLGPPTATRLPDLDPSLTKIPPGL